MKHRTRTAQWKLVLPALACALSAVVALPARAESQQLRTFFDYFLRAWVVGEVTLQRPVKYRGGELLVHGGRIEEIVRSKYPNARNLLFVYERSEGEPEFVFEQNERVFLPIEVLSKNVYWRDNLPDSPRHGVLGGKRYIFRGDDAAIAKKIGKAYAAALEQAMPKRSVEEHRVFIEALHAGNRILREDATRELAASRVLVRDLDDASATRLGEYLEGDWPDAERIRVIESVGMNKAEKIAPSLEKLAEGEGAVAAAALDALEKMDRRKSVDELSKLLDESESVEVRRWAAAAVGERAADDEDALAAAIDVISTEEDAGVRSAAAKGLGRSGAGSAVAPLEKELLAGGPASRAAGMALAQVGTPEAIAALKKGVESAEGDGAVAAVLGMAELRAGCGECVEFLAEQHEAHEHSAVRDLIGIVLQLNTEHDH